MRGVRERERERERERTAKKWKTAAGADQNSARSGQLTLKREERPRSERRILQTCSATTLPVQIALLLFGEELGYQNLKRNAIRRSPPPHKQVPGKKRDK
jgi:hypothetical protein